MTSVQLLTSTAASIPLGTGAAVLGGVAAIVSAIAAWFGHRLASTKIKGELEELATRAEDNLSSAAARAFALANDALTKLDEAEKRAEKLQATLDTTLDELHQVLDQRLARDVRISELEDLVEQLRARIAELEAKVGGRRDSDPDGPALS